MWYRRAYRAALRTTLQQNRFAELREGVWLRPDNLKIELSDDILSRVRVLRSDDEAPTELAGRLWDLPGWARTARRLLDEMATAIDIPAGSSPRRAWCVTCLPIRFCPGAAARWLAGGRAAGILCEFAAELAARRDSAQLMEAK